MVTASIVTVAFLLIVGCIVTVFGTIYVMYEHVLQNNTIGHIFRLITLLIVIGGSLELLDPAITLISNLVEQCSQAADCSINELANKRE